MWNLWLNMKFSCWTQIIHKTLQINKVQNYVWIKFSSSRRAVRKRLTSCDFHFSRLIEYSSQWRNPEKENNHLFPKVCATWLALSPGYLKTEMRYQNDFFSNVFLQPWNWPHFNSRIIERRISKKFWQRIGLRQHNKVTLIPLIQNLQLHFS